MLSTAVVLGEGSLQQLCSDLDRGMPSKAKREKEQKWKLARNAVWGCVPARLGSEVPAHHTAYGLVRSRDQAELPCDGVEEGVG